MLSAGIVGSLLGGAQVSAQVSAEASTTFKEQQDKPLQVAEYGKPDVTGLWYHINQKQTQLANRELGRLKSAFPQWVVPSDVETALYQLNNPSKSSDVVTNQKALEQSASNRAASNQAASNPATSNAPSQNTVAKDAPLQKFAQKHQRNVCLLAHVSLTSYQC